MQQATLLAPASPSVSLVNDRPATTSLEVAKFFGKRHDDVLKSIRNLRSNCPESFHARNFAEMSRTVEIGNGATREEVYFILFRDGFMLLVMGYTGKKAMQIKIAYIEAFNAMEAQVYGKPAAQPALPDTTTPSTATDRRPLRSLVNSWARQSGTHQEDLWPQVRAHFQLERIDHLPVEWIPDAIAWVQAKIDALAAIEARALPTEQAARCSVPSDTTIIDDIRMFAEEVEQARQKNIELQQRLFDRITKLMARIGIQYIGAYDTADALGFAVNGVYYVQESCRHAVMETHRPASFCGPAALMAEFAGMIGGDYKLAAKKYTEVR